MIMIKNMAIAAILLTTGMAMASANDRVGAFMKGNDGLTAPRTLAAKEEVPATKPADKYVCPMGCSESDKPGTCPKCGMTLKKVNAEPKHQHQH